MNTYGTSERERGRLNIANVNVDPISVNEAAKIVFALVMKIREQNCEIAPVMVCTPNSEIMMDAQTDAEFMKILNESALVIPDGAGVVLAARLLGFGKIVRATGFDLTRLMLTDPVEYPLSFYLFGAKAGVAEKAASNILAVSPETRIVGCHDGYFSDAEEPEIIKKINASGADVLFIALGAPKAEKWAYRNREKLRIPVCIGVGGTIDILAGEAKLTPPFFRSHGLEWLYRLACEPWRAKRMIKLPMFILHIIRWRLSGRPPRESP